MSQFIGTTMSPKGFAGELTRGFFDHTTEVHKNDGTITAFGVPVKVVGTKVAKTTGNSDAVYGFAVREFGQADTKGVQGMEILSVLRRGYMTVSFTGGTPALGGQVYLSTSGVITAEKSSNTAIPNCTFMGVAEGNIAEIAFNI